MKDLRKTKANVLALLNELFKDNLQKYAIEAVVLREYANWHSEVYAYEFLCDYGYKVGDEVFENEYDAEQYVKKLAKMDLLKELKGVG